jgi:hypothetical protein
MFHLRLLREGSESLKLRNLSDSSDISASSVRHFILELYLYISEFEGKSMAGQQTGQIGGRKDEEREEME